ncbi:MAG: C39 family peptidase [Chloroflexi bacterium]|nr:C39 family peptidase [Chloroflexota bacterium]
MRSRAAKRRQHGERRLLRPRNLIVGIPLFLLMCVGVYYLPPVYERMAWRVAAVRAEITYALNPPEEIIFLPNEVAQMEAIVAATLQAMETSTTTPPTPTLEILDMFDATATATIIPTPLPASVELGGVMHQYQRWNNCGPATLSMGLSYWGWVGTQYITAEFLKPNERDVNVMPYEMGAFVEQETELHAVVRVGGDLDLIKNLIANGFPVILEKGFEQANFNGWMGHYSLITGYDDGLQLFNSQDSFNGSDFKISYERALKDWQAFNYTFILIYSSELEAKAMAALGQWADEAWAVDHALEIANQQIGVKSGRELYFAWYNKGTNHNTRREYSDAAFAYNFAFVLYSQLEEDIRPWRMVWYQTGPYKAYYNTQQYQEVINLANTTLFAMSESVLEESYYWRGLAKEALGDIDGAISDFRRSIQLNANFSLGWVALNRLGVSS